MLRRLFRAVKKRLTPMTPAEYREAHFRILLSSAAGAPMAEKDGELEVRHITAKESK